MERGRRAQSAPSADDVDDQRGSVGHPGRYGWRSDGLRLHHDPPVLYGVSATNWACAAPGYKIFASLITLNSLDTWNHTYTYTCDLYVTTCTGDSRSIATHEFGHMEGLAHVDPNAYYEAVMKAPLGYILANGNPWFPNKWWPNNDDLNGLIAIYGAYP